MWVSIISYHGIYIYNLGITLSLNLYLCINLLYKSIIYYFKIRNSGKAKADFGKEVSIYNLLFQDMEIREGNGRFWRRSINLWSTTSRYKNRGGQRLILAEEYRSKIYYFKIQKSGKAKADFGRGVSTYNLLFQNTEIREGKGWFWRRNINL